jgi:diguanylate cyclase (GGDEF)-like protein/PAS domain S-box-containing protein
VSPPRPQVLVIDDSHDDAELIARELRKGFGEVQVERVDTVKGLKALLELGRWDVVIADNRMPGFTGVEALELVKANNPDLPFILVTRAIGDDAAVEMLKAGADEYVRKENLQRLTTAFKRQLREAELRRERRGSLDALRESEQRFRQLADNIDACFCLTDPHTGRVFYASQACERILGCSLESLYGEPRAWSRAVHPDDRKMVEPVDQALASPVESRYRIIRPDGAIRWLRCRRFPVRDQSGAAYRIAGVVEDVTERYEAERRIARLNRVYAVLSGINALIVRVRRRDELYRETCRVAVEAGALRMAWCGIYDRRALSVVPVACHGHEEGFLGLMALSLRDPAPEGRGLVGRVLREKRAVVINDIEHDGSFRLQAQALARGYRSAAVLPLTVAGEIAGMLGLFAAEPLFFDDDEVRLLTELAGDISFALDHIEKSERLDYLAYYDAVTGLANRTLFMEYAAHACATARDSGRRMALATLDIDRFKTINDTLGRQQGDALLKEIADRLSGHRRESSRFARIGADRFAVIVPTVQSEDDVARLMEQRFAEIFGVPFRIGDHELMVRAKAGVALFPGDGTDAETLYQNAEAALKKAKRTGERYLFYQQEMTVRVGENLRLENRLRRALEREEFVLHYQPKIDLQSGRIAGLEGLIRWMTPQGELVPPAQFIPLMEETGLILEAGAWAMKRAVMDHQELVRRGYAVPRIAVNVSAVQLRKRDFVETVKAAIAPGASPPGIDLEITESLLMEDVEATARKLSALRELGLEIAIDDFGTGYSSLAYLAKLPVNALKIDRSFIITMLADANAMTLVSTIVALAHSLKLKVVAEGVDSQAQAAVLRRLGCDQMQGYLYSQAVPWPALLSLLDADLHQS